MILECFSSDSTVFLVCGVIFECFWSDSAECFSSGVGDSSNFLVIGQRFC